jgi:hypothetical protein
METGIVNKSRFAPTGGGRRKAGTYLGDVDVVVERPVGGAVVILAAVIVQARHPPLLSPGIQQPCPDSICSSSPLLPQSRILSVHGYCSIRPVSRTGKTGIMGRFIG